MEHREFSIGTEFFTDAGRWRCTDVGARTIVAIKISDVCVARHDGAQITEETVSGDPSWFNGPPYAVAEEVFDEDSLIGCWA